MDTEQQRQIARRLREGDVDAWRALYDGYAQRMWRWIARRMADDPDGVADVVQETFLAAARSAEGYDPERASLWSWLCGIARNRVALYFRKTGSHSTVPNPSRNPAPGPELADWLEDRQPLPREILERAETRSMVMAVLERLPPAYEELLSSRYFDGATIDELAAGSRSTPEAIRSKLARARRAFRKEFRKWTSRG